ncbi:MAG: hypothetical protein GC196_01925, partial [Hyphomonas sp.]|nr:hypothetical protein [Hyphomonas sp.]
AATKVLNTSQQRCRVHWMRNLLGRVGKTHRAAVAALVKTVFVQETQETAREQWRGVPGQSLLPEPPCPDARPGASRAGRSYRPCSPLTRAPRRRATGPDSVRTWLSSPCLQIKIR